MSAHKLEMQFEGVCVGGGGRGLIGLETNLWQIASYFYTMLQSFLLTCRLLFIVSSVHKEEVSYQFHP